MTGTTAQESRKPERTTTKQSTARPQKVMFVLKARNSFFMKLVLQDSQQEKMSITFWSEQLTEHVIHQQHPKILNPMPICARISGMKLGFPKELDGGSMTTWNL